MPLTDAQKRAIQNWNKKNLKERYDRLEIFTPSGEKDLIKEHAKNMEESLNGFVNRAINETMRRDKEHLTKRKRLPCVDE